MIFQAAVLATVSDSQLCVPGVLLRFVLGALGAVVLGLVVARIARWVTARVTDTTGRSALTLVLPFAVYLAAEEVHASGVVAVVFGVRAVWMAVAWLLLRRSADVSAAPRTRREAVVLTWCGMRGLATLALALSLPMTTDSGASFPARAEIVVIASTVLVATLLLPGFTLPALVRALGVAEDTDAEHAAERVVAQRARSAALARMAEHERAADLPDDVSTALHERMARLGGLLRGEPVTEGDRDRLETIRRARTVVQRIQNEALAAARAEVLAARREPGVDPEAADRVLHRLDLRTVLLD